MLAGTPTLNAWAADWSALMLALVWQSTVLAAAIGLLTLFLRKASPSVRYWLWQIVAIKLLLLPLWSFAIPAAWLPAWARPPVAFAPRSIEIPAQPNAVWAEPPAVAPADLPAEPPAAGDAPVRLAESLSWQAWLMAAWAAVVAVQWAAIVRQRLRLGRLLARTTPAPEPLERLVALYADRLGLARVPRVVLGEDPFSPFVCGARRPVMVLPCGLAAAWPADELAPVVVHELAHVKRRDLVWGWLPQIARLLYFFHPVAHWVAFQVRLESELACDAQAMALTGQAAAGYAELLVRVMSQLLEPALLRSGSAASVAIDGGAAVQEKG